MKRKIAVGNVGQEEFERMRATITNREAARAEADVLFDLAPKDTRKRDRDLLEKLFVQAKASQNSPQNQSVHPQNETEFKKESAAKNVEAYFDQQLYLDEAQRRFPELLKVAGSAEPRPSPDLKRKTTGATNGPIPTKSPMSGGSA